MANSTVAVSDLLPTLGAKGLSPSATDVAIIAAVLSATLIYCIYYGNHSAKTVASQLAGQLSDRDKVTPDEDPFRDCDFSNVKVTKILIHPIKVRIGPHLCMHSRSKGSH